MADPDEILSPTDEKANFLRLTRLLISGGTRLLRETLDKYCPPRDLSRKLSDPSIKKELTGNHPKLTKPQRDTLYPSPGAYGESKVCDITLLFRLLRTNQICNLTPPLYGWDKPLASGDYSLAADLMRVKDYRNKLYAHVEGTMDIAHDDFQSNWSEIREVLVRIAGHLSREEKKKWQMEIDKSLKSSLTADDKRNVEELEKWYRQDMELKKTVEEGFKRILEENDATRNQLEELSRLMLATCLRDSHTTAESGLTEAPSLGIHMQAFAATNPVADFLALLGRRYIENVNPSTAEEFDGLVQYLDKVRKVIITDIRIGSLTIVVKCSSLQILRELWEDYLSGHLGEMVQKYLVTDNTLSAFGVTGIEIKTSINEEEYKACEQDFLKRQAEDLIGLAQPEKKRQKKDTYGTKSDQGYVQADSSSLMSDTKPQGVKTEQPRISPDSSRETLKSTEEQSRHRSPRPSTFEESPVHKVEVPTRRSPGKPKASSPDEDETPYKRRRTDTMEDKANEDGE